MTTTETPTRMFGQAIKRREDPRLITGQGNYLDDIKLTGMLHAAILRSVYGHARITGIDVEAARALPGVIAVITGDEIAKEQNPLPCAWTAGGVQNNVNTPRALAVGTVRFTGEGVAMVVAESAAIAYDALDLIEVDYEPLDTVVDAEAAMQDGAPQLHENAPNNLVMHWTCGKQQETATAIDGAEVVVKHRIVNQRLLPTPMETRGYVARYDQATGEYTEWMSSQAPHVMRLMITAFVLGIPENKLRCIAPDVGGGFGSKIFVYPEMVATLYAAKATGRPVKWVESRRENYVATTHGRDHITDVEIAGTRDGKITALRAHTYANLGAYLSTIAPGIPTTLYGRMIAGVYKIPSIFCEVRGVYTNTAMVDAYRGAGRPEATYLIERAVDMFAHEIGMDPAEVRRRNFIQPDDFPYDTGIGMLPYDSGNYEPALDKALEMIGYKDFRREQAEARRQGRLLGIGVCSYVEVCGVAPSKWIGLMGQGWGAGLWESANVKVHLTGKVVVTSGSLPHGQGHETTFAQLVSDELGVPYEDIICEHSDTQGAPFGFGTYGSRSAAVGGTAIYKSVAKIKEKARKIAAHMLEAAEEDIEWSNGKAFVRGAPDSAKTIQEIALQAHIAYDLPQGMEPYLDETTYYDPPNCTFPFGTHICTVEIGPETGKVALLRYVAVDDVGRVINPLIVDGQIHGGIAQG
ncbi:MAG TPA: xanthine dehydrogenase family protein molybdopterin-binding subunit, partial [Herpetosiphonaceae bacterium]|nr:xanthine dehydrogenase family protein molybdopterin-binding subunit [Herpetosiphonaceae bacterium]